MRTFFLIFVVLLCQTVGSMINRRVVHLVRSVKASIGGVVEAKREQFFLLAAGFEDDDSVMVEPLQ